LSASDVAFPQHNADEPKLASAGILKIGQKRMCAASSEADSLPGSLGSMHGFATVRMHMHHSESDKADEKASSFCGAYNGCGIGQRDWIVDG
jgi:hypothetical protein